MNPIYKFFDGKTAEANFIYITYTEIGITGKDTNNKTLLNWPYESIKIIEPPSSEINGIITHSNSAERLYIDINMFSKIESKINNNVHNSFKLHIDTKSIIRWGIIALLVLIAFYQIITHSTDKILHYFPTSIETYLNVKAREYINKNNKVCTSADSEKALNKLLNTLKTPTINTDTIKITVIEKEEINALALPGREIIIYNELLKNADNAEEIAGVIAHEIGHIEKKHSLKSFLQNIGIKLLFNSFIQDTIDLSTLIYLSYSRTHEEEADQFAFDLLTKNHINPNGTIHFFEKNKNSLSNSTLLNYFSSHPTTTTRMNKFNSLNKKQHYRKVLSDKELSNLQNICEDATL